jgi:hypothetical protein
MIESDVRLFILTGMDEQSEKLFFSKNALGLKKGAIFALTHCDRTYVKMD